MKNIKREREITLTYLIIGVHEGDGPFPIVVNLTSSDGTDIWVYMARLAVVDGH